MAAGAAAGLGLMAKYAMAFFVGSVITALLLTGARRFLWNRWLVMAAAAALLIVLPNLIWQARHDFVSLDFLTGIHARDVKIGRTRDFLPDQLKIMLLCLPLAVAGMGFCRQGRWRPVALMYAIPLLVFMLIKGRGYYLAGAYPMLYAAGSVWLEPKHRAVRRTVYAGLCASILVAGAVALPIAPPQSTWGRLAFSVNGDFAEEIGWPELTEAVAQVWKAQPPHTAILAGNYGVAGAINLYGPPKGLPEAISGVNSFWQKGYGEPPPERLVVTGLSATSVERNFEGCQAVAQVSNQWGILNEETREHPSVFVCRGPRKPWPVFWNKFRYFG